MQSAAAASIAYANTGLGGGNNAGIGIVGGGVGGASISGSGNGLGSLGYIMGFDGSPIGDGIIQRPLAVHLVAPNLQEKTAWISDISQVSVNFLVCLAMYIAYKRHVHGARHLTKPLIIISCPYVILSFGSLSAQLQGFRCLFLPALVGILSLGP